jgi:hypothetical protein
MPRDYYSKLSYYYWTNCWTIMYKHTKRQVYAYCNIIQLTDIILLPPVSLQRVKDVKVSNIKY